MSTAKDPVRLLFDPACPESQRAVLLHGMTIEPPRGAEERVWQALAGAIAVAGATAAATQGSGHAPAPAKVGVSAVKLVAMLAALATAATMVAMGFVFAGRTRRAAASRHAVSPNAPTPGRPCAGVGVDGGHARVRSGAYGASADRAPHMPRGRHDAAPPATREREMRLLDEARGAMHRGDAATALRRLDEHRRLFPTGDLEEDRELLAIEALLVAKQDAAAAARAAAFLRRHPESTRLDEIRALGDRAAEARRR